MKTQIDRIQIQYELTFRTPFHCGTGIRAGLVDRTVVRDNEDYLYIPGSTIKGVVREYCEQLERTFEELDPRLRERVASPHDARMALYDLGTTITMITRIFGSSMQPGQLFFDDACQSKEDKRAYDNESEDGKGRYIGSQIDLYTQVRLNRPTRTAVRGALYTSEYGVKGLVFHGSINGCLECMPISEVPDGPTYSLLLLLAGLYMIECIGGNKSSGKGRCSCKIIQLQFNEQIYREEQWQSWLDQLDVLSYYSMAQEGEL